MVTSSEVARLFLENEIDAEDGSPVLKTVSIRLSLTRLAYIDSMAENASVSRNVMANNLLAVGMGSVLGELPDVIREDIEAGVSSRVEGT